jgi:hypothetical protein
MPKSDGKPSKTISLQYIEESEVDGCCFPYRWDRCDAIWFRYSLNLSVDECVIWLTPIDG